MLFHEYLLWAKELAPEKIKEYGVRETYGRLSTKLQELTKQNAEEHKESHRSDLLVALECQHVADRRPFYNVYPTVEKCLENTKLEFTLRQISQLDDVISLCFAHNHEPLLKAGRLDSLLISLVHGIKNHDKPEKPISAMLIAYFLTVNGDVKKRGVVSYSGEELLSEMVGEGEDERRVVSLAAGVCLLAHDRRFVEPILLARDRGKEFTTPEDYQKAVERAKKRGRNGFTLGKDLQISPHMRRPHFAIRWTGAGRTTPKLVPIKGSVINRSKIYPVPTGYLDE